MKEYLRLKKSNCKNCYKCIRNCPVKSIRFSENQADIISDECILCGQCFVACPQNAKEIRNDLKCARGLVESGAMVYASIAPSFIANYDNITILSMEKALTRLGFASVEETALGATIVKRHYDKMAEEGKRDVIITSCCHTVNLLIQKYYPKALPYLAHVISPMLAHSTDIKRRHPEAKTVFIGPCISKKAEAESYPGIVDCVLTFEELAEWLKEENIVLEHIEDNNEQSLARLFPVRGGIIGTMAKRNQDYSYFAVDGIENCINAIKDIINGSTSNCFIEMSSCTGGCIGGPVMDKNHRLPVREYLSVCNYAGKEDFVVEDCPGMLLKKDLPPMVQRSIYLDEDEIRRVLKKIGKVRPEDELNCGSCGYDTCRDKAYAVIQGKADLNMCLPFLKDKAESFSDNIIKNTPNGIFVLNEALEVQQINTAACNILNIEDSKNVLGKHVVCILDPIPFMETHESGRNYFNKSVYLAEYRKYVDQTVIYDKSYHIIICIMRDVTEETKQREGKKTITRKTIEITDKVIEKQMRTVQEIASLLGETTAETKIALTKLKESLKNE